MYLGVDIGGTFTDLALVDNDGRLITTKALSTPGELEVGVFNAVQNAAEQLGMSGEQLLSQVVSFGHGTTQARQMQSLSVTVPRLACWRPVDSATRSRCSA